MAECSSLELTQWQRKHKYQTHDVLGKRSVFQGYLKTQQSLSTQEWLSALQSCLSAHSWKETLH